MCVIHFIFFQYNLNSPFLHLPIFFVSFRYSNRFQLSSSSSYMIENSFTHPQHVMAINNLFSFRTTKLILFIFYFVWPPFWNSGQWSWNNFLSFFMLNMFVYVNDDDELSNFFEKSREPVGMLFISFHHHHHQLNNHFLSLFSKTISHHHHHFNTISSHSYSTILNWDISINGQSDL